MAAETHRVFSLKYRPSTFEEMVGQSHVKQTLVNALQRNQVGHGYIFSGPRGVGKTTVARLFAKALNCAEGPGPKICNRCDVCREITDGNSLDVIEMDGASNRKIEDVRALRENVRFVPTRGRYKIYIIDEVHMLTQEAFNALLKTLEEPPEHVVFLLATTDPQKIPETIHSRCQELEFHRIPPSDLESLLRMVCQKEKISIDAESVGKLSEWADGSARDVLVALEQASAFSNSDIQEEKVDRLFGWVDNKTVEAVIDAIVKEEPKEIFRISRQIEEAGKDISHFLVQMARRMRTAWSGILEESRQETSSLKTCKPESILRMISAILETERNLRGTRQPGLFLAVKLIDLIGIKRAEPLSEIVRRLDDLETRLLQNAGSDASNRPADRAAAAPAPGQKLNLSQIWAKLVEEMTARDATLSGWLKEGSPIDCSVDKKVLTVVYARSRFALHQQRISSENNNSIVDAALSKIVGAPGWHLQAVLDGAGGDAAESGKNAKEIPTRVRAASDVFESRGVRRRE